MNIRTRLTPLLALLFAGAPSGARAEDPSETTRSTSTQKGPTPYTRELATHLSFPLEDLEKVARKGFGRTETVLLVLLARKTGKPWEDLVKERRKGTRLKELAEANNQDYIPLFREAQRIKAEVDARYELIRSTPSASKP